MDWRTKRYFCAYFPYYTDLAIKLLKENVDGVKFSQCKGKRKLTECEDETYARTNMYNILFSVNSYDAIKAMGILHCVESMEKSLSIHVNPCVMWEEIKRRVAGIGGYQKISLEDQTSMVYYSSIIRKKILQCGMRYENQPNKNRVLSAKNEPEKRKEDEKVSFVNGSILKTSASNTRRTAEEIPIEVPKRGINRFITIAETYGDGIRLTVHDNDGTAHSMGAVDSVKFLKEFTRMNDPETYALPKLNCDVIVTYSDKPDDFRVGKVYKITDGKLISSYGVHHPGNGYFSTIDEVVAYFSDDKNCRVGTYPYSKRTVKFIKVVE